MVLVAITISSPLVVVLIVESVMICVIGDISAGNVGDADGEVCNTFDDAVEDANDMDAIVVYVVVMDATDDVTISSITSKGQTISLAVEMLNVIIAPLQKLLSSVSKK